MSKITHDIQQRVVAIKSELNESIKERSDVIHGVLVARVAQEHVLMVGPGGTGKSFLARSVADHISDSKFFESAFDETTDPSQVFGPPDIKAMVEQGKTRRVPTNMLPEATDAFLDEFFNGNGPLLHSLMPALNERVWHNNGIPSAIPLRQAIMGTNKLNADADQAALWDRVHLRYQVGYIKSRNSVADMIGQAIIRMAAVGRGTATHTGAMSRTLVTLDELDTAHKEALSLDIPDPVFELFQDLREELASNGIVIGDRRQVEGMAAVLANAWVNGHESVEAGDLDILSAMWWHLQEDAAKARGIILAATNPGEKKAMDLLDDLDGLRKQVKDVATADDTVQRRVGVEVIRNCERLLNEAKEFRTQALAAGSSTTRLDEVIERTDLLKVEVGTEVFKLNPESLKSMTEAARV